eukprot:TRINITY_DN7386_c0_g1_i1.p1 TRINITY_DN7386_c0_g1~~TRINITY_DN7386_c0_g1_i1.p1  ORF type:complete len:466 (+),score=83.55 TRINITY_DN7386_c0_g1_i1:52-1449(+)
MKLHHLHIFKMSVFDLHDSTPFFCDLIGRALLQAGAIGEEDLRSKLNHYLMGHFPKCYTGGLSLARQLSLDNMRDFLNSPGLYIRSELEVLHVIRDWILVSPHERASFILELLLCMRIKDMKDEEKQFLTRSDIFQLLSNENQLFLLNSDVPSRSPRIYPCVVGLVTRDPPIGEEPNSYRRLRDSHVFVYKPEENRLVRLARLMKIRQGSSEATGYKAFSHKGHYVVLSGGEFSIGRNNWNKLVWRYDPLSDRWKDSLTLVDPQRHHAVCSIDEKIYLIGGYGRHRCVLDSVYVMDLNTSDVRDLEPLPVPMHSPGATAFGNDFIYVFKSEACVYDVQKDSWTRLSSIAIPKNVEFSSALAFKDTIYLTSSHSRGLYTFKPKKDEVIRLIGQFHCEVQNVCIVKGIIYSFSSDQFDCKSSIESYDCSTGTFAQLWEERNEKMDFSPYYSFGCFPLLMLKDIENPL